MRGGEGWGRNRGGGGAPEGMRCRGLFTKV